MMDVVIVDSGGANLASLRFALERIGARALVTADGSTIASADRVILPGVGAAAHAMERLRRARLTDVLRALTQPVLGICLGMQLLFQRSEEADQCPQQDDHSSQQGDHALQQADQPFRRGDQRFAGGEPSFPEVEAAEEVYWFDRSSKKIKKYPSPVVRSAGLLTAAPQVPQSAAPSGTTCLRILPGSVERLIPTRDRPIPHMGWNTLQNVSPDPLLDGVNEADYAYFVHSYALPITEHTLATTDYGGAMSAIVRRANFWGTQFHPERSGTTGERILQNFLRL
jgi:imidazole glycerol-phosphate synthase subunit HisH